VTNARQGTTDYGYLNNGESLSSVTGPLGASSSSAYDNTTAQTQYLPSASTDTMNNRTTYLYAGPGNLSQTSSGTGADAGAAHLDYNTDGTVHASTTPKNEATSNATLYGYDSAGNLQTITPPPTGHGTLAPQTFTYDGYGRVKTTTTGNGVTITYGYDEDDRTTSISYSDNTPDVTYNYDEDGNVTLRTDAAGDTHYGYDHLNRLTDKSGAAVSGGPLSYTYDDAGNLRTLTDGRGTTHYDYNAANELTSLTEGKTGRTDKFGYNADHQRTDTWYNTGTVATPPASFAGHIHVTFDTANRLTEIKTTTGSSDADGARVADLSYSYTATINGVSTDTNVRQSVTNKLTGSTTSYRYDSRARLISATDTAGPDYSYGYGLDGNLTSGSAGAHTYNAVDQLTDTGASYDADGNLTASPGSDPALTALTYTGADQTASITTGTGTTNYGYAGADQNELVTAGTRQFTQGSTGVQAQTDSGAATYFERDPDGTLLAEQTPDGREFYYYFDGLGSVIGLIDTTGTNAATYTYDPYGGHATVGAGAYPDTTVAEANPYRYAGGYRDQATGLYKFGARYYDPTLGRWTQPDPQRRLLDLKQGNLYAYAGDNPCVYTDPTGKSALGCVLGQLNPLPTGSYEVFLESGLTGTSLGGAAITSGFVAAAEGAGAAGIALGLLGGIPLVLVGAGLVAAGIYGIAQECG
jgi:RHS repeat-associated protein